MISIHLNFLLAFFFGHTIDLYRSINEGTSSNTADPTHILGRVKVGDIEWEYIGSSKVSYFVDVFVGFPEITCTGNEGELTIRVDKVREYVDEDGDVPPWNGTDRRREE